MMTFNGRGRYVMLLFLKTGETIPFNELFQSAQARWV